MAAWSAARLAAESYGLAIAVLIRPSPGGPQESAWSSLLEASTPEDLLPLVAALPICVSLQAARTIFPSEEVPANAWAVIVDGASGPKPAPRIILAEVETRPSNAALEGIGDSARRRMLRDPIVPLLRALTSALEPAPSTAVLRGLTNQQKLPADRVARLLQFFRAGHFDGQHATVHAAGPTLRIWMDRAPAKHAEALRKQIRSHVETTWRGRLELTIPDPPPLPEWLPKGGGCFFE